MIAMPMCTIRRPLVWDPKMFPHWNRQPQCTSGTVAAPKEQKAKPNSFPQKETKWNSNQSPKSPKPPNNKELKTTIYRLPEKPNSPITMAIEVYRFWWPAYVSPKCIHAWVHRFWGAEPPLSPAIAGHIWNELTNGMGNYNIKYLSILKSLRVFKSLSLLIINK